MEILRTSPPPPLGTTATEAEADTTCSSIGTRWPNRFSNSLGVSSRSSARWDELDDANKTWRVVLEVQHPAHAQDASDVGRLDVEALSFEGRSHHRLDAFELGRPERLVEHPVRCRPPPVSMSAVGLIGNAVTTLPHGPPWSAARWTLWPDAGPVEIDEHHPGCDHVFASHA